MTIKENYNPEKGPDYLYELIPFALYKKNFDSASLRMNSSYLRVYEDAKQWPCPDRFAETISK